MEENKIQAPLFNGKNYTNWKYRMEIQLTAAKSELIRFVNVGLETLLIPETERPGDSAQVKKRKEEERKELRRLDAVCKNVLVTHIDEGQIEIIKDLETSYQIWQALSERFKKTSVTTRMHLGKQYALIKYAPKEEKFENFCLRFDKLVRELKEAGAKIEKLDEILQFLGALPVEYKPLVTSLKTTNASQLTMNSVRSDIEDFEMDQEGIKKTNSYKAPSVAFFTRGGARYSPYQNKFGFPCNNCGNLGHRKRECWCPGGGAFRGGRGRGNYQNHGERDQQPPSRGRGGSQNQDGGRGGHSSYSSYNHFGFTHGFRGGRGGRGFGGRARGWQHRGGRGGFQGNPQTAQLTQSTTTNPSTSSSTNSKTETANLAKLDDDIVYSFMCEQVPEIITLDSCHNALNTNSSGETSVTSYDGIAIEFILDSGASKHLVKEDVPVQYKKWLSKPVIIQVAKEKIILRAFWKGVLRCKTFVNGDLEEEIFMWPPQGLDVNGDIVCKLKKSLYGLKQAPKEWNKKFNECVKSIGFDQCNADRCIYVRRKDRDVVYLLLYVDDFLIASNNEELLHEIKNNLMLKFKMRDLGEALYFLGIKITRSTHGLFLSQENYVKKIVQKFKMDTSSAVQTPLEPSPNLDLSGSIIVKEKPYRELIGSLMYATMFTRPDICVAVNLFSQFQTNATEIQWKGLKRILRYLQGTPKLGIWFKGNSNYPLVLYVDADFANNPGRKSISGFVIEMFGDPVLWATRKQNSVALSSTEAEFVSLATGVAELLWLKQLLKDLGVPVTEPIPVFEDNQPCIHALESWETKRLKHVDVKYNFVKDLHRSKIINVKYIPTGEQKADIFTKGLPFELFKKHRINIGMCELST